MPRRFRRLRVLLLGCGDVGLRFVAQFSGRAAILATARRPEQAREIRARGARAIDLDLDAARPARRPERLAAWSVYMAPPADGPRDRRLLKSLARARAPGPIIGGATRPRWVYTSTTGVFGPAAGAVLDETARARPDSARARRRRRAESLLRQASRAQPPGRPIGCAILRVPGIYAADRLPLARLQRGLPALQAGDDAFTNHINADDLAQIAWLTLFRGRASRLYIASDGQDLLMGDYFDQVADATGLPRPPRLPPAQVEAAVGPMMWSFMRESRRLRNQRLLTEIRPRLRYPSVASTLSAATLAAEPARR